MKPYPLSQNFLTLSPKNWPSYSAVWKQPSLMRYVPG
nr:MAG TPA: hypothetical protein [Caudoviricetes sp.]